MDLAIQKAYSEIEELRQQLHGVVNERGFKDVRTAMISSKLDDLVGMYLKAAQINTKKNRINCKKAIVYAG